MNKTKDGKLVGLPLYLLMLGMLLAGTANTVLTKWQNSLVGVREFMLFGPFEGIKLQTFTHPYIQSANMFLGELLCLGVYGAKLLYLKRQQSKGMPVPMSPGTQAAGVVQLKTNINPLLLAIPACFDIVSSTLMNVALTLIPASIYQMLRGMIIIVVALMSIIFLKRKLYRHHWTSIGFIFVGVGLVGVAAIVSGNSGDEEVNPLGIILIILAQLFGGGLYIVEEKLLGDYYLDPLKVVGLEGLWGLIITLIILPIAGSISCDPGPLCYYGYVEHTKRAF